MKKRKRLKAELYRSKKNKLYYPRLRGQNGEIVWSNKQGYERIAGALEAITMLGSKEIEMPAELK